ncbi:MAG: dihydrofolate reductase [Bacteroidales bacterium]|jgi:dihydrofolate reductase|nr:dihydrofolate reductase [Bacteroidales bacterium]
MYNINIIVAIAANDAIGNKGDLLWHLPEDLKYFKRITNGHTVVMGLRTWHSLPVKPLPKRRNIVLSDVPVSIDGVEVYNSVEDMLPHLKDDEQVFIIGGGMVYRQFLPIAETLYITHVLRDFEADTFFPEIAADTWCVKEESEIFTDGKSGLQYKFVVYARR